MIAEIVYRKYDCHPETCTHANHKPWQILVDNAAVDQYNTKIEAVTACKAQGLMYTTKELTWDDIL